jgi:hypothetical protein
MQQVIIILPPPSPPTLLLIPSSLCRVRSATPTIVRLLLEHGAEVNKSFQMNGVAGITALHVVLHTVAHFMNSRVNGREDPTANASNSKLENSSHSKLRNTGVKSWIRTVNLLLDSGHSLPCRLSSDLLLPSFLFSLQVLSGTLPSNCHEGKQSSTFFSMPSPHPAMTSAPIALLCPLV